MRGNLVTTYDETPLGMFTFFVNDERFTTDGWSPLGYKPAVGKLNGESVNLLTEGHEWSVDWK